MVMRAMRMIDREIVRIRAWAILAIRLIAIYVVIKYGFLQIGNYLMLLSMQSRVYGPNFAASVGIAAIAGLIAFGLWRWAPLLATKIFEDFTGKCPKCHFNLENFRADRCPECGLYLGEEFHAPLPSASDSDSRVITTDSTPE